MRMRLTGALIVAAISIAYGVAAADDAKTLYDKKCAACHSLKGEAGKFADKGGPLDGVGNKRDEAWLRAYFADPKSKIPDAKMPKMKLSPEEWNTLVQYMLSLK